MNSITGININISLKRRLSDYKQLAKVGLSISVVFSSIAGYLLATKAIDYQLLLLLGAGGFLIVTASNAFNQIIEKDTDALMIRTMNRPLPSGRMTTSNALVFAITLTIIGLATLYSINPKSALFGAISIFLYTCVYTPLKPVSPLAVFAGALPGAIPFMIGWVSATNEVGVEAGFLFMIQFFWQFPHFWSIGWLQFEDYKKAGFAMLPVNKKDQSATRQIIFYTMIMVLISVTPVLKFTGTFYIRPITAIIIALLGLVMLYYGVLLHKKQTNIEARKLMLSSVGYITIAQIIYVVDKFLHVYEY